MIAVNRCFDTEVGDLISKKSLHGKWLQSQLQDASVKEVEKQIKCSLDSQGCIGTEIAGKEKGNQLRYPVGTIAEVKDGETIFYLLALTEMNEQLNSHCTLEDYTLALSSLMYYFDRKGQGRDMLMPIIGAGFSRLDRGEEELLELMISVIKIHQTEMRGNIKIVVHKDLKSTLSIADL